jgi:hypothetical protein
MRAVDKAINTLETIISDRKLELGQAQLGELQRECIELSELDCFVPGTYRVAEMLLECIRAARAHCPSVAFARMRQAITLLRSLPGLTVQ